MKVERVEHIALNEYEVKLLDEFSELMYDIEREVTDGKITDIIADIRHHIGELEDYLWREAQ